MQTRSKGHARSPDASKPGHGQRLLTIKEVCERTSLQRWRLYQMISKGEGPKSLQCGRTLRISEAALAQWIDSAE